MTLKQFLVHWLMSAGKKAVLLVWALVFMNWNQLPNVRLVIDFISPAVEFLLMVSPVVAPLVVVGLFRASYLQAQRWKEQERSWMQSNPSKI